jgi:hypothetical protein
MNELFDKHNFPEKELIQMSEGLADMVRSTLAVG